MDDKINYRGMKEAILDVLLEQLDGGQVGAFDDDDLRRILRAALGSKTLYGFGNWSAGACRRAEREGVDFLSLDNVERVNRAYEMKEDIDAAFGLTREGEKRSNDE